MSKKSEQKTVSQKKAGKTIPVKEGAARGRIGKKQDTGKKK